MIQQDELKQAAARAALRYVEEGSIVGVGTGSTANFFIDELAQIKDRIRGAVASSAKTAERLARLGIPLIGLTAVDNLPMYVDGADEVTAELAMIKGGGGALTGEKIIAAVARKFVCVADESKLVHSLGAFALPVEVIPMAERHVANELARLGGRPTLREGFRTDHGNLILDVAGLTIADPIVAETAINQIAGVVTNGLFARRGADVLLLGTPGGVRTMLRPA